jgi:hypothetical protein
VNEFVASVLEVVGIKARYLEEQKIDASLYYEESFFWSISHYRVMLQSLAANKVKEAQDDKIEIHKSFSQMV